VQRSAQGTAQLAQIARREANVRGFNDVFTFSGWLALGFLGWLLSLQLWIAAMKQWRRRRPSPSSPAAPDVAAAPR